MEVLLSPRAPANGSTGTAAVDGSLTDSYLSQLLSFSLDTFNKEPQALRAQQDQLRAGITDTAVSHYQGFINAASSFSDISKHIEQVHQQLHALVVDMKHLNSKCTSFASHATAIQEKRSQTRSLLAQHSTVLELLEVPQLIDTCVRNGNYDEALDLMAFMNKVTFVHSDVPVIANLLKEVKACSNLLLEQLLARLSSNVMLPESLRSISYIRRLAAFSEPELRQRFLQCRETWLQSVIDGLNDSNPADYIRQLTDVYRLHIFDIVMQYRAIFSEADPSAKASAGSEPSHALPSAPAGNSAARILYGWAHRRVQLYVETVEKHFPRIQDGNSLAAVIEACMYCGGSLSRVGLDFRGLLLPVFSSTVLRVFEQGTSKAVLMFAAILENHKWVQMPLAQRRPPAPNQDADGATEDLSAAYCLLEHPPLAVFANAMIAALNSVRSVALLRLAGGAAELMQAAVRHACGMLAHHGSVRRFSEAEIPVHAHACKAMCDVVCPLLATTFRHVFSPAAAQPDFQDCLPALQAVAQEAATHGAPAAGQLSTQRSSIDASARSRPNAGTAVAPAASVKPAGQASSQRLAPATSSASNSSGDRMQTEAAAPRDAGQRPAKPASAVPPSTAPQKSATVAPPPRAVPSQSVEPPPVQQQQPRAVVQPPVTKPQAPAPAQPERSSFAGFGGDSDEDDDDGPADGW